MPAPDPFILLRFPHLEPHRGMMMFVVRLVVTACIARSWGGRLELLMLFVLLYSEWCEHPRQ